MFDFCEVHLLLNDKKTLYVIEVSVSKNKILLQKIYKLYSYNNCWKNIFELAMLRFFAASK